MTRSFSIVDQEVAEAEALEQALYARQTTADLAHHSDRGVQYLSIRYIDRLAEADSEHSIDSVGDSYDNAMAESVIGLYKTDLIRRQRPWRHGEQVEFKTMEWVDWLYNRRLLKPIEYIAPAKFEVLYYRQQEVLAELAGLK